ncbi:uncharacterized [Tachysurus ichikawai]
MQEISSFLKVTEIIVFTVHMSFPNARCSSINLAAMKLGHNKSIFEGGSIKATAGDSSKPKESTARASIFTKDCEVWEKDEGCRDDAHDYSFASESLR